MCVRTRVQGTASYSDKGVAHGHVEQYVQPCGVSVADGPSQGIKP